MNLTRRGMIAGSAALGLTASPALAATRGKKANGPLRAFRPGQAWLDTVGKPIQAHAGAVIAVGDTFYWYGENKEFTDGKSGIESWGIRFYSSNDLYNWTDLGPLIPPDTQAPKGPLGSRVFPERPHIIYNRRARKFVCWIKIRGRGPQYRVVMEADRITGPYRMVNPSLNPAGLTDAGDFDLVADPRTGRAYTYFEQEHKRVIVADLTDDYHGTTGRHSVVIERTGADAREAPAHFERGGRHYLLTSGTTGYFPNPSEAAVADDYHGPFTTLGDLHPQDRSRTSYGSQISFVFKHPGKRDLYIALADRWLPDLGGAEYESGDLSRLARSGIDKATAKPRQPLSDDEKRVLRRVGALSGVDTSASRYVWLPIRFDGDRPVIEWRDEWSIEDYR